MDVPARTRIVAVGLGTVMGLRSASGQWAKRAIVEPVPSRFDLPRERVCMFGAVVVCTEVDVCTQLLEMGTFLEWFVRISNMIIAYLCLLLLVVLVGRLRIVCGSDSNCTCWLLGCDCAGRHRPDDRFANHLVHDLSDVKLIN